MDSLNQEKINRNTTLFGDAPDYKRNTTLFGDAPDYKRNIIIIKELEKQINQDMASIYNPSILGQVSDIFRDKDKDKYKKKKWIDY